MRTDTYDSADRLRRRLDDVARKVLEWDADGALVNERPYTPGENAAADARAQAEAGSRADLVLAAIAAMRTQLDALESQMSSSPQIRQVAQAAMHANRARASIQSAIVALGGARRARRVG